MPQSGTLELEIHSVPWKKTDFTPRYSGLGNKVDLYYFKFKLIHITLSLSWPACPTPADIIEGQKVFGVELRVSVE